MPAAYNIYADQLRVLRRGHALYNPEPALGETPVEIGDVGYTKEGAFCRLFNVCQPATHSINSRFGVPQNFHPLDLGESQTHPTQLEPGPLHSRTISYARLDAGMPGYVNIVVEFDIAQ
jgi:hypothetical protein